MQGEYLRYTACDKALPMPIYFVKLSDGTIVRATRIMGDWEDMVGQALNNVTAWAFSECRAAVVLAVKRRK